MIYGMSPFEGISVGRDPRSPVWWERHVTHGAFPFTGRRAPSPTHRARWRRACPRTSSPSFKQMGAKFE